MPVITEPKLIAGNANMTLAKAIARRMSMHRGMSVNLVDARVERFNDAEIFVEVYENVRGEDMYHDVYVAHEEAAEVFERAKTAGCLARSPRAVQRPQRVRGYGSHPNLSDAHRARFH